jgi:hypothetical protein
MTQQELERAIQEVWILFKETDKKIAEVSGSVAALTGKWGKFVEGLIAPGAAAMFKERGIEVDRIFQRVKAHKDGEGIEIDILAVDKEYAVLIEAKSSLGISDVKEHIERLKIFKKFFPEYSHRKVIGSVAGIVIEEDADKFAYHQGLFVIGQTGETVTILNDKEFKPKIW